MIDSKSHYYQHRQQVLQDHRLRQWCRKNGMSLKKIESHPHINDIATLLMFDEHEPWMNQEDTRIYKHCWQWSYEKEMALTNYHKSKLLGIITGIEYRRQAYQQRQLKRQHIQARSDKKLAAV